MDSDKIMRKQLVELLEGKSAHLDFDRAIANLPPKMRGVRPPNTPHTVWRLVEHMRLAQRDILDFSKDGHHVSPEWPDGYWPESDAPESSKQWTQTVKAFHADLEEMIALVKSKKTDLLAPIEGGKGQTIFREAMLVADHNAYHLGQIVMVRRVLGVWKD